VNVMVVPSRPPSRLQCAQWGVTNRQIVGVLVREDSSGVRPRSSAASCSAKPPEVKVVIHFMEVGTDARLGANSVTI
jgi:hypothetical protein